MILGLLLILQAGPPQVTKPPILDGPNPPAPSREQRTDYSVICRDKDKIVVTLSNGRITQIVKSGREDRSDLKVVGSALRSRNVSSVAVRCRAKSADLVASDGKGDVVGVFTLRYVD